MTPSGKFELWFRGDNSAVRYKVGEFQTKKDAEKKIKRITGFGTFDENKYEILEPTVKQQLGMREQEIAGRGRQVAPRDSRSFQRICMDKIDQKKKQYVSLEAHERNSRGRVDHSEDKKRIQYGIAGIKWALDAFEIFQQVDIMESYSK